MPATNRRVFYACHAVAIKQEPSGSATTVQGAQSVGVTTNFNLEQGFQLGHLSVYDNIVANPQVELTLSKALDGYDTIYKLATGGGTLISNANDTVEVTLGVGEDTRSQLGGGTAIKMTGMTISSLSYTFPTDGNFTEDVTFIGTHKVSTTQISAPTYSGAHILRRQNFVQGSSTLPAEVSGQNIQSITISADITREEIFKLGQYAPFFRSISFPLEITTEIEIIAKDHDEIYVDGSDVACTGGATLPAEQTIRLVLCDGTGNASRYIFDLGSKNTISSVNYTGGDTGGGNVAITYTYTTYNTLDITG